jgi:hypothetical protein
MESLLALLLGNIYLGSKNMPWEIKQGTSQCSGYGVFKQGTNQLEGCHETKSAAQRQVAALYASENKMGKADSVRVGQMVSWNSSGGRATGRVTRIIRSGKVSVPGSSFSITGTPEDPAALIRVYRNGKPTDTIVGHKVKTLRSSAQKSIWSGMFQDWRKNV